MKYLWTRVRGQHQESTLHFHQSKVVVRGDKTLSQLILAKWNGYLVDSEKYRFRAPKYTSEKGLIDWVSSCLNSGGPLHSDVENPQLI